MTKHGTKSSQKAEMTPEEFANKIVKRYTDEDDSLRTIAKEENDLLSDLHSVIRGELIRFLAWYGTHEIDETKRVVDNFLNNNQ